MPEKHFADHRAERNTLQHHITTMLKQDKRIVAAWLFGSLGRGDGDALSDLDLWVVVEDDHIKTICAGRRAYVTQAGHPLLFVEAPQHAPAGGAYLMALYDAPTGPLQVDWYWQPRALAQIPAQTHLLLNRANLPHTGLPPTFPSDDRRMNLTGPPTQMQAEECANHINYFWVLLLISAKYVARLPRHKQPELLNRILKLLHETQRFAGIELSPPTLKKFPRQRSPLGKLNILRDLAGRMEWLMAEIALPGQTLPTAVGPGLYRYLARVETAVRDQSPFWGDWF